MKQIYEAPEVQVINMEVQGPVLQDSDRDYGEQQQW